MPEKEFQTALKAFAQEVRRDIEEFDPGDRDLLRDDLGFQLKNELYRADDDRQRRALGDLRPPSKLSSESTETPRARLDAPRRLAHRPRRLGGG